MLYYAMITEKVTWKWASPGKSFCNETQRTKRNPHRNLAHVWYRWSHCSKVLEPNYCSRLYDCIYIDRTMAQFYLEYLFLSFLSLLLTIIWQYITWCGSDVCSSFIERAGTRSGNSATSEPANYALRRWRPRLHHQLQFSLILESLLW